MIPSQDEWIKAAYFDPNGGGTYSYWKYPTNPGEFGQGEAAGPKRRSTRATATSPTPSTQPLAIYHDREPNRLRAGARRTRRPKPARPSTRSACRGEIRKSLRRQPRHGRPGADPLALGHARPGRQRGRVDRHDHQAAFGVKGHRVWRRLHGGIANAPAYQLWLSAVGLQPQDNSFFTKTYPWLGLRIGVIGKP